MKLFTKDIDKRLFQQYQNGSDLDSQVAVTKIFNPYGNGRWFLLNSDPQDPDYLWAIVQMGDVVEVGSVLRSELESVRVSPFKFPLERDLGFTMVNAGELYRGLLEGKFYQKGGSLMAAAGMEVGRYYKDKNGDTYRYIGENSQRQTLFNDGQKVIVKSIDDFEEEPKNNKLFGIFEDGGIMAKGGKVLMEIDTHKAIKDGDKIKIYRKELVFDSNYDIIGKKLKLLYSMPVENEDDLLPIFEDFKEENRILMTEANSEFSSMDDGGFVDKTDEELKGMTDDELFEYLDAKAAYMKQYAKPLSSFKAKNYAANSVAIQFQNEGTDKLDANFPSLSKINQQATKDYEETIAKRNKMAKGGVIKKGVRVRLKDQKLGEKRYNQGYTGEATILTNEPNQYGMYQIDVDVEDGFPRYRGDAYAHKDEIEVLYKWYLLYDGKILRGFNSQSEAKKNMDALVKQNKDSGYSIKKMVDDVNIRLGQKMAMGGKVKFQDKVKAIKASLLKTKKVPKKVQKDYGKTYNAKEAELAAKRIAGAMAKKGMK